jgi:hypothetical protein
VLGVRPKKPLTITEDHLDKKPVKRHRLKVTQFWVLGVPDVNTFNGDHRMPDTTATLHLP